MTREDILKLKAITLYILNKCGGLDFIHLFKILYFAERSHYAKYGKHLVNDTFCALAKGPVPSFLYDAVKVATGIAVCPQDSSLRIISSALEHGAGETQYYYVQAKEKPDMDELSVANIKSLDDAIAKYVHIDNTRLSELSHDIAWTSAWNTAHNSPMDSAKIATAGGASADFVAYIQEQEKLDEIFA